MAMREYFRQPIVDTFDIRICLAKSVKHSLDFLTATEQQLHKIDIPLEYYILESGTIHGLAFWFDVAFQGSSQTLWLSTSPTESLTHWYQVRCLLEKPILVKVGQILTGSVSLQANVRLVNYFLYFITVLFLWLIFLFIFLDKVMMFS